MFKIKKLISKLLGYFGYEIQRHSSVSSSVKEPFYHFRDLVKETRPIIFDVGAYKGVFTNKINKKYKSKIYAFEPLDNYYNFLVEKFKDDKNIRLFNIYYMSTIRYDK